MRDIVKEIIDLPKTVVYNGIWFDLHVKILENEMQVGYYIRHISTSSEHYNDHISHKKWNNPFTNSLNGYLWAIPVYTQFDLLMAVTTLYNFMEENNLLSISA